MTRYREIGSAEMTSAHGVESPAGSDAAFICLSGLHDTLTAASLHPECKRANYAMTSIVRAAAIAAREGVNYAQSKAVFKAARQCAGLRASAEWRGGIDRLTVEEELRFLDQAYGQDGRTGLMLQTLLETGARVSELVRLRIEDVSLAERVITIRQGKGGKRREVPIRRDLAQLLRLHVGTRCAGPLFASRQQGSGPTPHVLTRQRVGQVVRAVARAAGISKRVYPHVCAIPSPPGCSLWAWTSPICSAFSVTKTSPRPASTPKPRP
jgi:integrase